MSAECISGLSSLSRQVQTNLSLATSCSSSSETPWCFQYVTKLFPQEASRRDPDQKSRPLELEPKPMLRRSSSTRASSEWLCSSQSLKDCLATCRGNLISATFIYNLIVSVTIHQAGGMRVKRWRKSSHSFQICHIAALHKAYAWPLCY